jgi:hypothetical protein
MIPIGTKTTEAAFKKHEGKIKKMRESALSSLRKTNTDLSKQLNATEVGYLQKVISYFEKEDFLISSPDEIESFASGLPAIPVRKFIIKNRNGKDISVSLADLIRRNLKYEYLRSSFFAEYFIELGIKACVYCNAHPAFNVTRYSYTEGKYKKAAKYELDHYHNKDDFPFLSICLYNLYPSCGPCNRSKKKLSVNFKLYDEISNAIAYLFQLDVPSLVTYLNDKENEKLKILFEDPHKPNKLIFAPKSLEDTFHITGIYEIQKDIAEEMIAKAYTYNDALKNTFKTSFGTLFSDANLMDRLILGSYAGSDEIHKRTMTKFMQDISRQLTQLKHLFQVNPS